MNKISILAVSDVHIGCPRLNPHLLHERMEKYLYPQITPEISILFICGDFFDTLLNLNAHAAFEAMDIIKEIKLLCRQNGCDLRVLRGTFTHDRNQPKHFINGEDPNDLTIRLFDTMAVEHHEKTGLDILYMPDNLASEDIYADIRKLLDSHGIEKVDILVHHGYFKHMLPEAMLVKGVPHGCLDADIVDKFVKGCTLNGHVHISSIYRNVISIGSFDRLTHGEEEPKGFYRIDINENVYTFKFIENESASIFKTINLTGCDASTSIERVRDIWRQLSADSRVKALDPIRLRIISDDKGIIEGCSQFIKSNYENVIIDQGSMAKRENTLENIEVDLEELPIITPTNLGELLLPILKKTNPNVDPLKVNEILKTVASEKNN